MAHVAFFMDSRLRFYSRCCGATGSLVALLRAVVFNDVVRFVAWREGCVFALGCVSGFVAHRTPSHSTTPPKRRTGSSSRYRQLAIVVRFVPDDLFGVGSVQGK